MTAHLAGALPLLVSPLHLGLLATTKKTSSGSSIFLILLVVLGGGYLWMRSQKNKARARQAPTREVVVGDEVTTTSGIIGLVRDIDEDRVSLEVAPGTVITVMRQSIGRQLLQPGEAADGTADDADDHDGHDHDGHDHDGHDHDDADDHDGHDHDGHDHDDAHGPGSAFRPTDLPDLHAPDEHERHEHPDDSAGDRPGGLASAGGSS